MCRLHHLRQSYHPPGARSPNSTTKKESFQKGQVNNEVLSLKIGCKASVSPAPNVAPNAYLIFPLAIHILTLILCKMPSVEILRIAGAEPLQSPAQIRLQCFQQRTVVIGHQGLAIGPQRIAHGQIRQ